MAGYISPWKLGIITLELDINFIKQSFGYDHIDIIQESKNLQGDYRKSIFKVNVPTFQLYGVKLTQTELNTFQGLKQRNALLNFKYRDDLKVIDEQNTSTDTTHVTLINTAATGITIDGVWLLSDPTHAGTDYYAGGGSYNATTRVVTLHSALPGANTDVLINYSYTGHGVVILRLTPAALQGQQKNYYNVSFELQAT
jgi:hypothetical protein